MKCSPEHTHDTDYEYHDHEDNKSAHIYIYSVVVVPNKLATWCLNASFSIKYKFAVSPLHGFAASKFVLERMAHLQHT